MVVEAHDSAGRSSAGGTFNSVGIETNNFSNTNGFDITDVDNIKISPVLTQEGASCTTANQICTEQELSLDKSIKLIFQK